MLHHFLANHRDELVARCKAKVSQRPTRLATDAQLRFGIPLFLDQLVRTLRAEQADDKGTSLAISGPSGGDGLALSAIGVAAAAHGKALLELGFSVDQVVHDYGDLCQAITELAFERDAPFAVAEFRTLNRCLDNAIADAVTEFSVQRDSLMAELHSSEASERMGLLVHELRNSLQMATLAVRAMERGGLTLGGATGAVLKRSLASMRSLVHGTIAEVRSSRDAQVPRAIFSLAAFVQDARESAELEAQAKECVLRVDPVDPVLRVEAHREHLLRALGNLLGNAIKFTHLHTEVILSAYANGDRIFIDVKDRCGGLPHDYATRMFMPFHQQGSDRTGLGLGLSIAKAAVESSGGSLSVTDVPGFGCVFRISLENCRVERRV